MPFQPTFRYSLKKDANTWYYWENDTLHTTTSPTVTQGYLRNYPEKWQETETKWTRSMSMVGMIRVLTIPYIFVGDGASIIRAISLSGSIESKIYAVIERYNTDLLKYEVFFRGEVDLLHESDGDIFNNGLIGNTVSIVEGGIAAQLNAAENVPYEIELSTANGAKNITMDGIYLRNTFRYGVTVPFGGTSAHYTGFTATTYQSYGNYFIDKEGDYSSGIGHTTTKIDVQAGTNDITIFGSAGNESYIYLAYVPGGVTISIRQKLTYGNLPGSATGIKIRMRALRWSDVAQAIVSDVVIWDDPAGFLPPNTTRATYATNPVTGSATFTGDANDRYYVVFQMVKQNNALVASAAIDFNDSEPDFDTISVLSYFKLQTTVVSSLTYAEVIEQMLDKITGSTNILQSSVFSNSNLVLKDTRPYYCRLTCGDALRGLTVANGSPKNPSIRISWGELKKDFLNRFGLGMGIVDGKVVIERVEYFLDQTNKLADLGEVKSLVRGWIIDYFANSAQWGYPNQTYDKLNGRDEFNVGSIWKYPITAKTADLDNKCLIRADMYGIEYTRANLIGKKTVDALSDNDTFLIETEANMVGGAYPIYRPQNSYTQPADTGLLYPASAYNLAHSPKRILLRNGKWLRSMHNGLEDKYITYQTSDKNAALQINLGGGVVVESDNILISKLDAPMFKPRLFHIEVITPLMMPTIMAGTANGYFGFTYNGIYYKGFPMEVGIKNAMESSYQMSLLCTADTDVMSMTQ